MSKYFFLIAIYPFILFSSILIGLEFTYITTMKNENDPNRRCEILLTLEENVKNDYLENLVILYEGNENDLTFKELKNFNSSKIHIEMINFRPSVSTIFSYLNEKFPKDFVMMSNSDIVIDESIKNIESIHLDNTILALSRFNRVNDKWKLSKVGFFKDDQYYSASQDVWIMKTPFDFPAGTFDRFWLGKWGVEKFVNYFIRAGYKVLNPCLEVKIYHFHSIIQSHRPHSLYLDLPDVYLKYSTLNESEDLIIDFKNLVTNQDPHEKISF